MSEICPTCGLPKDLCVCETIAKGEQQITVKIVRKRFGKKATVIEGLDQKTIDLKDLAKKLKNKFACGGTAKDGIIELQGVHTERIKEELEKLGFNADQIVIK